MSAPVRVGARVPTAKLKPYLKTATYQSGATFQKPPPWGGRGLTFFAKCRNVSIRGSLRKSRITPHAGSLMVVLANFGQDFPAALALVPFSQFKNNADTVDIR